MVEAVALESAHDKQRAGGRDQHADAVGGDVGRHAGRLLALVEALDPERVDDDVLRRRSGGDKERAKGDDERRYRRIAIPEEDDRGDEQELRQQEPAAAAAEKT